MPEDSMETINTQQHVHVLRSELLAMARLTQRAVDYSIKAYQLGKPEFCQHASNTDDEVHRLQRCIADRGHVLLSSGLPVDSNSRFVSSSLRICSALHIMYAAATGIAQDTMLSLKGERIAVSPAIEEMGQLVNCLVRLCIVALFNKQIQPAKTVLQSDGTGQWFDVAVYQLCRGPIQRTNAQVRFELAIHKSLDQIAEQTHEIADAITFWLDGNHYIGVTREVAGYALRQSLSVRKQEKTGHLRNASIDSCRSRSI
jgi:phosphate uptake regulator